MSNNDVKISDFQGITSVDSDGLVTIVQNGTNLKIPLSDFIASLGVTGTIVQKGPTTATPILDTQGSVNNIRNLENGSGVKASVSAQDGITLDHNFTQNTVGVPLLINPTLTSPTIASAVAGTGINIVSLPDGSVQFAVSTTPAATTTVIIAKESDFPTPVSDIITLEPATDYLIVADITTANRFVLQDDTLVRAIDSSQAILTYTGTGDMFTAINTGNKITKITLACPSGSLLNIQGVGGTSGVFQLVDMTVSICNKVGTLTDLFATQFSDAAFLNIITDGTRFTGTHGFFLAQTDLAIISAGALFDVTGATFNTFSYGSSQVDLGGTSVMLKGDPGSANINTGGLGTVINTRITGPGTPLSGISTDDALWAFQLNDDIADTRTDGLLSMQGNAVETVIVTQGVGVLVAGIWVIEETGQMSGTAAGRLTNDAGKTAKLPITSSVTIVPASGGAQIMGLMIAVNGVVVSNSIRTSSASPGSSTSITIPWQENLSSGDFVELFVSNESTTTNVLVSSAVHRVN